MLTPDGRAQAFRVTSYSWLTSSEIFCTKCLTSSSADCVPRLPRLWQGTVQNLRVYCDGCSGFVLSVFVEVLLFYIHSERHNKTTKPSVKLCASYQHLPSSDNKAWRYKPISFELTYSVSCIFTILAKKNNYFFLWSELPSDLTSEFAQL